jgi:hypothetical protein
MTGRSVRAFLLVCVTAAAVSAQETRSVIFGRVTDPQGASIAGAEVSVTNTETNTAETLKTNDGSRVQAS